MSPQSNENVITREIQFGDRSWVLFMSGSTLKGADFRPRRGIDSRGSAPGGCISPHYHASRCGLFPQFGARGDRSGRFCVFLADHVSVRQWLTRIVSSPPARATLADQSATPDVRFPDRDCALAWARGLLLYNYATSAPTFASLHFTLAK